MCIRSWRVMSFVGWCYHHRIIRIIIIIPTVGNGSTISWRHRRLLVWLVWPWSASLYIPKGPPGLSCAKYGTFKILVCCVFWEFVRNLSARIVRECARFQRGGSDREWSSDIVILTWLLLLLLFQKHHLFGPGFVPFLLVLDVSRLRGDFVDTVGPGYVWGTLQSGICATRNTAAENAQAFVECGIYCREWSPQSSSESQIQVLSIQRLLSHWNSLGSQPRGWHLISSDASEQSASPSQTALLGIHSPFMQVDSSLLQAVGDSVGAKTAKNNKEKLEKVY